MRKAIVTGAASGIGRAVAAAPHAIKPDEIVQAVLFLLGPSGSAFTGAPFVMDAG